MSPRTRKQEKRPQPFFFSLTMSHEWSFGKLLGKGANGEAYLAYRLDYITQQVLPPSTCQPWVENLFSRRHTYDWNMSTARQDRDLCHQKGAYGQGAGAEQVCQAPWDATAGNDPTPLHRHIRLLKWDFTSEHCRLHWFLCLWDHIMTFRRMFEQRTASLKTALSMS